MESNKLNRRRFLQLSATLAAAGVVTACGGGAATATTGTASSSSSSSSSSSTSSAAAATTKASSSASTSSGPPPTIAVNQTNATPASGGTPAAKPAQYKEAPALADMVKAGKLPPVEKRLPDNPRVLKPLQEVGQYGGTWHRAYTGLSDYVGPTKLGEEMLIEWDAPDPNTINIIANVVEKWEQNSDASEYTFHLRKGMKWSDGQDVTTDDVKFWFNDVQGNKDITPAPNF
ncbi:MAG: ABC transporter substrate-binding protein, partial [Thermomicrobiales bacterium]